MKLQRLLSTIMVLGFAAALVPALISISGTVAAQISPMPSPTFTGVPATPTDTPPPTPTDTPVPPTNTPPPPTNTPVPPTSTPTPIPPAPLLGSFSIFPLEGVAQINDEIFFTVVFTDPGLSINPGFATFFWGDGDTSTCPPDDTTACLIDLGAGGVDDVTSSPTFTVGEVKGHHAYSEPGVYTVQLTARDEFGQFDTSTFEFVIIYDPSGGFVTGGGWIDSPAGAYKPDPDLTGKASFGFVSKYKKGASIPTGNTEFQFQVADLNFHSDTYDWLVVNQNDSRAQFKGEGTINGAGDYKFQIWAGDGEPDAFRIKIWEEDESGVETVVYDNGFDQPIGGGSIVVQSGKKNTR